MDGANRRKSVSRPQMDPLTESKTHQHQTNEDMKTTNQIENSEVVLMAIAPAVLVLLAFGGKPSLIALCFGTMFAYVFDILGAMEATVLTIIVTLMCLWGTLLFASRLLLEDSLLNIGILVVLTIILMHIFFASSSQFRAMRQEFESGYCFIESVMVCTIPLIASVVLTWFMCVEFPTLDLSHTFAAVYYVYLLVLLSPRTPTRTTIKHDSTPVTWWGGPYVLSLPMVIAAYAVPIILCPALHITLHHNVPMSTSSHRIFDLIASFLFPLILVILAAEKHITYWPESARSHISRNLFLLKLICAAALTLCLQTHPFFEEIKDFSGIEEPFVSVAILAMVCLVLIAIYIHRSSGRGNSKFDVHSSDIWSAALTDGCIVAAIVLAAGILGVLNVQNRGELLYNAPNIVAGAFAITEYYRSSASQPPTVFTVAKNAICLLYAAFSAGVVLYMFTRKHLEFLDFTIPWQGYNVHVQTLCCVASFFGSVAVIIPALLRNYAKTDAGALGHIPSSGMSVHHVPRISKGLGSLLLLFISFFQVSLELMICEQDWSTVVPPNESQSSADVIYPTYVFVGSSALLCISCARLFSIGAIGASSCTLVCVIQSCKLLHLVGIPSTACFSVMFLIGSLALPFVVHFSTGWIERLLDSSDADIGIISSTPQLSTFEMFFYPLATGFSCYWSSTNIFPVLLTVWMERQPSVMQSNALAMSIWFSFCAVLVLVYCRKSALLRSVLCLLSGVCLLISSGVQGPVNIVYDSGSPILFSLQPSDFDGDNRTNSGGIYILLSALLCFSAFSGVMPLRSLLQRVLFVALFAYCSAKCLEVWAFPAVGYESGIELFSLPWLCCIICSLLGTSTVLHTSAAPSLSGGWLLALFLCSPFGFLIWILLSPEYEHYVDGICWVALISFGFTTVCCRMLEFSRSHDTFINSHRAVSRNNSVGSTSTFPDVVCTLCSVAAFVYGCVICIALSHHTRCDFAIPTLSLIFLTVRSGALLTRTSSITLATGISSFWWTLSAVYSLFLSDIDGLSFLHGFVNEGETKGFFAEANISLWSNDGTLWIPYIHMVMLVLTLPSIVLSIARWSDSEDVMFVSSLVSCLPFVGAQIWSIRLLGITGALYAAWTCYDIGYTHKKSSRTI